MNSAGASSPQPLAAPLLNSTELFNSTGLSNQLGYANLSQPQSFKETQLFNMVMKVLTSSALSNTSGAADLVASTAASTSLDGLLDDAAEYGWRDESRFIVIITLGAIFSLLTFVGNLMVMISFKIDKQLQTISNYFLFSLAVADITIGIVSIPMFTYYTANQKWGIGYTLCQFWLCIDYLMSNASVLNLLLISFDRYFSVTLPLSYRPRRTTRKALIMISCTYTISMILWPPWIISWPYIEGKFTVDSDKCMVQFLTSNPYVTVGTAVAAFYLPVSIMIILYTRVYFETQRRQKEFGRLQASQFPTRAPPIKRDPSSNSIVKSSGSVRKHDWQNQKKASIVSKTSKRRSWFQKCTGKSPHSSSEDSSEETASAETQADSTPRNGSQRFRSRTDKNDKNGPPDTYTVLIELKDEGARPVVRLSNNCDGTSAGESPRKDSRARSKSDCNNHECLPVMTKRNSSAKETPVKNGRLLSKVSTNDRRSEKERKKNERKQESKAAKTLSAILFAFILTWTPYNLCVCCEAFFQGTIPEFLWTLSYFLCYINSTINPLCYALCNARFRHTYMRILRCKFKAERPTMHYGYIRR
ncbi:hypothetical protein WR25_24331 [Diploscapter pachys]|uniref:G-protein coupled receptors family 1 profile domain-containing protein n=1 Tax=Diploscapter pachys TaxID=2018661 RepID=A0A2A2M026_9BILA|nr:hypothetical protein WR25_24331 [Diploscapter pachys]